MKWNASDSSLEEQALVFDTMQPNRARLNLPIQAEEKRSTIQDAIPLAHRLKAAAIEIVTCFYDNGFRINLWHTANG